FDLRDKAAVEFGDQHRQVFDDLLPPFGPADRVLPRRGTRRDRERQRRLERRAFDHALYREDRADLVAPGADIEIQLDAEIAAGAPPQREGAGSAEAVVPERGEGARQFRLSRPGALSARFGPRLLVRWQIVR